MHLDQEEIVTFFQEAANSGIRLKHMPLCAVLRGINSVTIRVFPQNNGETIGLETYEKTRTRPDGVERVFQAPRKLPAREIVDAVISAAGESGRAFSGIVLVGIPWTKNSKLDEIGRLVFSNLIISTV